MSVSQDSNDFVVGSNSIQSSPVASQGKKRWKDDIWNSVEDGENRCGQKVLMCETCRSELKYTATLTV
uniref:Uncharacterized protein n=1 Tax=Ditylenchus dipsaci TaxID=166011 RepID=A0A915CX90_9BILA